jgi:hypothetical protein
MFDQEEFMEKLGEIASEATAGFDDEILTLEAELLPTLTEGQRQTYRRIEELNVLAIGACQKLTFEWATAV